MKIKSYNLCNICITVPTHYKCSIYVCSICVFILHLTNFYVEIILKVRINISQNMLNLDKNKAPLTIATVVIKTIPVVELTTKKNLC